MGPGGRRKRVTSTPIVVPEATLVETSVPSELPIPHTPDSSVVYSASQAATGGLFPKRLGVQANWGHASQAFEGNQSRPQDSGPAHFPKNLLGPPFAIGRPQDSVPVQFSLHGPSSATGQPQDSVPVQFSKDHLRPASTTGIQFSKDLLRPAYTTGQVIPVAKVHGLSQASNALGRPSLKRSAIHPTPATPWVQRRKIIPQPTIHPSVPSLPQTAFASIPILAPSPPHIKCQGADGLLQPTGQKCLLCKRDLSFTSEGPVYQLTVPPAVAVLPCGHTFHDHCLQLITPEDQCKNPPCIHCAIGET